MPLKGQKYLLVLQIFFLIPDEVKKFITKLLIFQNKITFDLLLLFFNGIIFPKKNVF